MFYVSEALLDSLEGVSVSRSVPVPEPVDDDQPEGRGQRVTLAATVWILVGGFGEWVFHFWALGLSGQTGVFPYSTAFFVWWGVLNFLALSVLGVVAVAIRRYRHREDEAGDSEMDSHLA